MAAAKRHPRSLGDRAKQRKLVAIDECPICEENIYPHSVYVFFAKGYAHESCAEFLRTQTRLMRESE